MRADVAVIGAGLAGLTAASELSRAGASVSVLEAAERPGGRIISTELLGARVELGAQWVGPGQDRILALADRLGVATFPTHTEGANLLELGSRLRRYRGTIPPLGPLALIDIAIARLRLDAMARRVPLEDPASSPWAQRLAAESFDELCRKRFKSTRARTMLAIAGRTVWGAEPEEMSSLHALHYIHGAGGLDPLLETEGGAQQDRLVGGSSLLVEGLAGELEGSLHLGARVRSVRAEGGGVRLELASDRVDARRAIVAVPPHRLAELGIEPSIASAAGRWRPGRLIKYALGWERPFWRERGLSGESLSDTGPATITFDASPPEGAPGIMVAFVGGADADTLAGLEPRERRAAVLEGVERVFGEPGGSPEAFKEQSWPAEPGIGVGPNCHRPPGTADAHRVELDPPGPPLHLAATEYADRWPGFMDGAVRSGERAARAALAALG